MEYLLTKEEWEEHKDSLPDRTFERLFNYFEIVQNNYEICIEYKAKEKAKKQDSSSGRIVLENYMENKYSSIKVIIFSAIFLEAVIHDYGASNLSDRYMKNYLDKLDIKSKWAIIPKLVTGKEFPRDSQAFRLLGELIKSRNNLVHYKTKKLPNTYEGDMEVMEKEKIEMNDVDDTYKCIGECLLELNKIDNTNWEFLKSPAFSHIVNR